MNPASVAQREYLEALMQQADVDWQSLIDDSNSNTSARDPWDESLQMEEASELIEHLKGET